MSGPAAHARRHSFAALAAAALLAACADEAPVGPGRRAASSARLTRGVAAEAASAKDRGVDLSGCDQLRVPSGSTPTLRVYARGVQIYRWSGAEWLPVGPSALLFDDAAGHRAVGFHYAGPSWQSVGGSKVVGAVLERCTPNPDAIPWLLLGAVSTDGPGVFERTTFIQRVKTVGGKAPAGPGSATDEKVAVPYTAEYFFYRGQ